MRNIFPKLVVENGEIKYGRIRKTSPKNTAKIGILLLELLYLYNGIPTILL